MSTVDLTDANFRKTIEENEIVFLDFWASWCAPCRSFSPVYEAVSEKFPNVVFGKIDTEAEQKLAAYFGVRSIPTVGVIRQGLLVDLQPGALGEAQLEAGVNAVLTMDFEAFKKAAEEEEAKNG